jgi:outer membrane protein assembly factor BamA
MNRLSGFVVATLAVMFSVPGVAGAQSSPAPGERTQANEAEPPAATTDVFDLWRKFRHKEADPAAVWDYRKPMKAFAPVIGAKPSSGALFGVAGNVAFYRGEPSTTHISSVVASLTFSTKGQTSLTDRFTMFGRDDRWRLDGDHRFQWTSLETYDLGTSADTRTGVDASFDFFRLHHTAYYRLRPALFAGAGLYFDNHINVGPREEGDAEWATSPYVEYSEAHDLPLEAQASAGTSVDLLWDTRDSFINPNRGWLAKASYRMSFDGFLGSDSNWQRVTLDVRSYRKLSRDSRHKVAGWLYSELIVGGAAPYLDLPGTGLDTYGRSARGYSEGQFRGERLAYGEIEYRGTLMRNGLLGMVAFLNVTTVSNQQAGEKLFDSFAPGGGAGLRVLINKRSQTNLCIDFGFGKQGSRGVYLAIQEAF